MKLQSNTEIWGPFINRPDFFNVADLMVENSIYNENIRITLDYAEDYKFIRTIYMEFEKYSTPSLSEVLELLKSNPAFLEINRMHKQIMLSKAQMKQIDDEFNMHKTDAMNFAKAIGKTIIANYTCNKALI